MDISAKVFNLNANTQKSLKVRERSSYGITIDEFNSLQTQPTFQGLIKSRVLGIGMRPDGSLELRASHYVGTVILENLWTITITEKVVGSTEGLFSFLSNARFKLPPGQTYASTDGAIFVHIVESFVEAVEKYVSIGRKKEYQLAILNTQRPSGRIMLRETIRFFSRGKQDRVSAATFNLSHDIYVNQVIAYCLAEIEVLANIHIRLKNILNRTRNSFLLFSDSNYHILKNTSDSIKANQLRSYLQKTSLQVELKEALEMAFPLLCGGGIFGNSNINFKNQTLFFDLQFLFEHSVLAVLKNFHGIVANSGSAFAQKLFGAGTNRYNCEPDLVVSDTSEKRLAVGDVKYKELESGFPDNSDVYQLLAHASAFQVSKSFLIYPSDNFSQRLIGRSANSIEVYIFTIRPSRLEKDISIVLEALNI